MIFKTTFFAAVVALCAFLVTNKLQIETSGLEKTNFTSSFDPKIDAHDLESRLAALGTIGEVQGGGLNRLTFSMAEQEARLKIISWFQDAGMAVVVDEGGNIIGKYSGTEQGRGSIATGSHIDTVLNGGKYDGALGVLAAVQAVKTLHDSGIRLNRSIEVIAFTDEENTMLGSKAMAGVAQAESFYDQRGFSCGRIKDCLKAVGGDWERIQEAARKPGEIDAYIELHIEQGPELEAIGKPAAVVEGIVAVHRYLVTVRGTAGHAGTTPIHRRSDALVAASHMIARLRDRAAQTHPKGGSPLRALFRRFPSSSILVATVGALHVEPNMTNVIPSLVRFSIDARALDPQVLQSHMRDFFAEASVVAHQHGCRVDHDLLSTQPGVRFHPVVLGALETSCTKHNIPCHRMPSRAGHDAQNIALIAPTGMLFVPSRAGVSHNALEHSDLEHCVLGANLLLHTLMTLDQVL